MAPCDALGVEFSEAAENFWNSAKLFWPCFTVPTSIPCRVSYNRKVEHAIGILSARDTSGDTKVLMTHLAWKSFNPSVAVLLPEAVQDAWMGERRCSALAGYLRCFWGQL